jgi:hypothetical protein
MSADPFLDLTRSLAVERRQPVPGQVAPTREVRDVADLRAIIHILASAMSQPAEDTRPACPHINHAAMEAS